MMNDILFGNNNKSVVKNLAHKSLKADRRRNLLIIVTIAFTTILLSGLTFFLHAQRAALSENIKDHYQAGCMDISQEMIHVLSKSPEVEQWGVSQPMGVVRYQDANLSIIYKDNNQLKLEKAPPIEGNLPEKETEIVVERDFLEYFNLPLSTGQKILLDLGDGIKREYTITGIIQSENASRYFTVLISRQYVVAHSPESHIFEFRFRLANKTGESSILKEQIKDFLLSKGVPEEKIFYSSNYFDMVELHTSDGILLFFVGAFLVMACSVVIYSIFYISVAGKIRVYGRLKAIGATTKQLKGIVRRESLVLFLYAVPIGIVIAGIAIFALKPQYWDWVKNLKSALVVAIVMFLTVAVSTRVPIRLAGRVSAIEAVRSNPYSDKSKGVSSKLHRRITPVSLAGMNFQRNRKKTIFTFISLGLTAIIFMCFSTLAVSIDVNSMASRDLKGGSYVLSTHPDSMKEEQTLLKENPLNEDLYNKLTSFEAITEITRFNSSFVQMELPKSKYEIDFTGLNVQVEQSNKTFDVFLVGLTESQMSEYFSEDCDMEGTAEYNTVLRQNGIIVGDAKFVKEIFGYYPKVGDILVCSSINGGRMEMPVLGIARKAVRPVIGGSVFYVTHETLKNLYPETSNFNTTWYIYTNYDSDTLHKDIFKAVDNPRIDITSLQDIVDMLQPSLELSIKASYIFTAFLFIFALINLINTLMTNLITRQQELSILQSIGMSFKQMAKMLSAECLWYVVITLIITVTVGGPAGMLLCSILNQYDIFGVINYSFPVIEVAVFAAILMVTQLCYSGVAIRYLKKQPLLERVKPIE